MNCARFQEQTHTAKLKTIEYGDPRYRPEKTHLKFSLDKCRTETSNIEISS